MSEQLHEGTYHSAVPRVLSLLYVLLIRQESHVREILYNRGENNIDM
ncbi:MAG: hypothetical protein VKL59_06355 [Nostocaceae cyanobacterium]|nr:hypothetical protein [Nostocaceae cyanobacterium]